MKTTANIITEEHPNDKLRILVAKSNAGNLTYDGIDIGGERLCKEIELEIKQAEGRRLKIASLSIIGYSLGGLFSRYALGLLWIKGILDMIECKNFITIATPHLGVRSMSNGVYGRLWNLIGSNTLSMSGRQIFLMDDFCATGRPLLGIMADPAFVFAAGLAKFKKRLLYSNVVNDEASAHYTSYISQSNPHIDLGKLRPNYLEGYTSVILDPELPYFRPAGSASGFSTSPIQTKIQKLPHLLGDFMVRPLVLLVFLIQSLFKTSSSKSRIRLHKTGKAVINVESYQVALLGKLTGKTDTSQDIHDSPNTQFRTQPSIPKFSLTMDQLNMLYELNDLGWRKYPIYIKNDVRSHAAIIVRFPEVSFDEGFIVLRHMAREFLY